MQFYISSIDSYAMKRSPVELVFSAMAMDLAVPG
jgi:hypothetical protein